ncbi:hypothetical protein HK097_000744 [Rhizophlyctis rosea]|uniref:Small nuclear ribonucleoprotein Prp3 C-terminal domain-containing protein n=1 Tax=Rhizophlyctis rosea TaxID=64517 RepID=A0AAD5X3M1_9FUNG|nr:hypothetical protein HK097_000744 [Rhizophlyctis rosea]
MSSLSRDALEERLATLELLESMFCGEGEFVLRDTATRDRLQSFLSSPDEPNASSLPTAIDFRVTVPITIPTKDEPENLHLNCRLPLCDSTSLTISLAPTILLLREKHSQLSTLLADHLSTSASSPETDTILEAISFLQSSAPDFRTSSTSNPSSQSQSQSNTNEFLREWYYLPSLSTKSKRQDLVTYALSYSLTGFVTPGKPGILCVEGPAANIPLYISDIKTISWADIPPGHKKISAMHSERFTVDGGAGGGGKDPFKGLRKFDGMTEVTFDLHGSRGNRNSLGQLEEFLKGKGVGEAFGWLFPDLQQ